jgi:Tfp pilus assembly protein PilX
MSPYARLFLSHGNTRTGAALIISFNLPIIVMMLSITALRNTSFETKIAVNHEHIQPHASRADTAVRS